MLAVVGACSIVILPDEASTARFECTEILTAPGSNCAAFDVEVPPGASDLKSVQVCAAIMVAAPQPPLLIVTTLSSMHLLPAVARAQRAARQLICGYVLIDAGKGAPGADPSGESWPDAPVFLIAGIGDAAARSHAKLRGWQVLDAEDASEIPFLLGQLALELAP
jgi:hypothetical protein